MATPILIPLNDLESLRAAGITYPHSEHAWRWLYRHRVARRLERAFKRVGSRILIDVPAYLEAVRAEATD